MILDFLKVNWNWEVIVLLVLFILIRTKVRGFFWKVRKTKEELSLKQFFGLWRKGIEGITPLQQSFSSVLGTWIIMSGIISGILINVIVRVENQWIWITVILSGSFIVTGMSLINSMQKYWKLKEVDKMVKELERE